MAGPEQPRDAGRGDASPDQPGPGEAGSGLSGPDQAGPGGHPSGLGYRARRRWALVILLVGMPIWIVVAVTVMNWLDARFGRQPLLVELLVYVGLGLVWALPFRRVFLGVGQAAPKG